MNKRFTVITDKYGELLYHAVGYLLCSREVYSLPQPSHSSVYTAASCDLSHLTLAHDQLPYHSTWHRCTCAICSIYRAAADQMCKDLLPESDRPCSLHVTRISYGV